MESDASWTSTCSPIATMCVFVGALAHRRRCGILLTAFAIAAYVATRPGADGPNADVVTKTRRAEDAAFSKACGLEARFLEVMGASMLGHHPLNSLGLKRMPGASKTR